ncbi:MAG TPA: flagellar hook-associated protein FlgK [Polyangiaceae bacterium]|nr:flagellar hook-associated protein FlgK [Polyangiaceae bacterium]
MGLNGLYNLASDAMQANSFALNVTGQNISNASTPGYVRRSAILETQVAGDVTYGGVQATGIHRAFDQFTQARLYDATGLSSSADSRNGALASVEALFNDTGGTGLAAPISALFSSFSALAANPSDTTTRANVLSAASNFAQAMSSTSASIAQQRADMLSQAQGVASEINGYATQIAQYSVQITQAQNAGQDASDLLDKRDHLLTSLSQDVDVHTATDGQGQLVVSVAGSTLVEGGVASKLSVSTDSSGAMTLLSQQGNGPLTDVTSHLTGGKLAGLKEARDVDAVAENQKLDQLAYDIGSAVNTQHAAGYALDGSTGHDLFSLGASATGAAATIAVDPSMVGHPELVAASSSAATVPGGSDNAVALGNLATAAIANGGTQTAADAYANIVGDIGLRKAAAQQDSDTRGALTSQVQAMRDSTSGVSLDEEMVNLSRYQSAYSAASKLFSTADALMTELLGDVKP